MTADGRARAAAQALAEALRRSEPISAFWQARAKLAADAEAQELLTRLSDRQRALVLKQQAGEITQAEIDDLRRLQSEAESHPVIGAYVRAVQEAQLFLPAVNAAISELLGFDFAGLARVAAI